MKTWILALVAVLGLATSADAGHRTGWWSVQDGTQTTYRSGRVVYDLSPPTYSYGTRSWCEPSYQPRGQYHFEPWQQPMSQPRGQYRTLSW